MAQDVCSKMAEDPFVLKEDGYLNADTDLSKIVYHPSLNVILICTRSGVVHVLDVNSGVVLQSSCLSGMYILRNICVLDEMLKICVGRLKHGDVVGSSAKSERSDMQVHPSARQDSLLRWASYWSQIGLQWSTLARHNSAKTTQQHEGGG